MDLGGTLKTILGSPHKLECRRRTLSLSEKTNSLPLECPFSHPFNKFMPVTLSHMSEIFLTYGKRVKERDTMSAATILSPFVSEVLQKRMTTAKYYKELQGSHLNPRDTVSLAHQEETLYCRGRPMAQVSLDLSRSSG